MKPEDKRHQNCIPRPGFAVVLKFLVPTAVVAAAVLYAVYLMSTGPHSQRKHPEKQARLVEVLSAQRADAPVIIKVNGTVVPARRVELKPQVSGKIVDVDADFIPGGMFQEGQTLMRIESADYELMVRQRESEVVTAQSTLRLEQGNQAVAEQEYKLLSDVVAEDDKELVLRKPQLAVAEGAMQSAEARLRQAKLDLERTSIVAPFNSTVENKQVDLGAMVSSATTLVTLTGTDEYWIQTEVPVGQLKWIRIPAADGQKGSTARVYNPAAWGDNEYRIAEVIRLCPALVPGARMATLLLSVKDPLGLGDHADSAAGTLLLGSYVNVEIEGIRIESAYSLDRSLLRDGDKIWRLSHDNSLEILPVNVVYRGENEVVIVDGISPGDLIVKTDISAPVQGMPLMLAGVGNLPRAASPPATPLEAALDIDKSSGPTLQPASGEGQ